MAGRAARYGIGGLAVAVAVAAFPLTAAEPVPPQPAPPSPLGFPPGVAPHSSNVTVYQRPPGAPEPPSVLPAPPAGVEPFLPQPPAQPDAVLPEGSRVNLPPSTRQQIRFAPRYAVLPNFRAEPIDKANNVTGLIFDYEGVIHQTAEWTELVVVVDGEGEFELDGKKTTSPGGCTPAGSSSTWST